MKATLRIPTRESYAYIEVSMEGTKEEIVQTYLEVTDYYQQRAEQWKKDKPPF